MNIKTIIACTPPHCAINCQRIFFQYGLEIKCPLSFCALFLLILYALEFEVAFFICFWHLAFKICQFWRDPMIYYI